MSNNRRCAYMFAPELQCTLIAAAPRHIRTQFQAEDCRSVADAESKLPHLAHAIADLLMALDIIHHD